MGTVPMLLSGSTSILLSMNTNVSRWPSPLVSWPRIGAVLRRAGSGSLTAERWALLGLLTGSALLFAWNLGASGWANAYYSAAVQAGSQDWLAFLFGSFDAGNAITVDKTPASLWVMELSARIFGFSSWSVLLPQAVEGVLAVWLLHLTVRRRFGAVAGLVAGAVLALTPVATLMFRYNNPDALLTLLLVAATYSTVRALEHASTRWLLAAGVAIGLAFLAKMLQGFLIIPAFAAVYLFAAPTSLRRRVWQVAAAGAAVVVSAGWWVALVMLWPAGARPFIGGSQTNSVIDLMLGYNGLGRITGDEVGRVGGGAGPFSADAGWLRLFNGELASQVSWLIPLALLAFLALVWLRRRAPRTDLARAQVLLWGGWLVTTGLVFSLMQGIFHAYYAVALAPAIGALVGIGAISGWRLRRRTLVRGVLAAGLLGSAAWAAMLLSRSPDWYPWLMPVIVGGSAVVAVAILLSGTTRRRAMRTAMLAASLSLLVAAPAVASIATAATPHTGAIPTAQPTVVNTGFAGTRGITPGNLPSGLPAIGRLNAPPNGFGSQTGGPFARPNGGTDGNGLPGVRPNGLGAPSNRANGQSLGGLLAADSADPALVAALQADADAYRWVAATTGSNNAAGLALSSGESVMSIGGFNGTDPSPTLEEFQAQVAAGEIHYYIAGRDAAGFAGAQGGSNVAAAIDAWVQANFSATTIGGVTVYDVSAAS